MVAVSSGERISPLSSSEERSPEWLETESSGTLLSLSSSCVDSGAGRAFSKMGVDEKCCEICLLTSASLVKPC